MKKSLLTAVALVCLGAAAHVNAAPIGYGNLVVVRSGTGGAALNNDATAAFLMEYTTAGVLQQTINLPTAASGANAALTLSGSATSEGFLKQSTNNAYLTLGGYAAAPGSVGGNVAATTAATVNRVVGRIHVDTGTVDTTTALTDAYNASNIRSAMTTDGTDIWTGGNGGTGEGGSAGVRYLTHGSSTSTRVNTGTGSGSNSRVVNIFGNQLYVSASSSPRLAIQQIGTGLPTTAGQTETTLPGMPTSGTHSAYDYWFKDANTVYMADDGSAANGGGIQKWTFDGANWSLAYILLNNGSSATAIRGLTGYVDGLGNAVLFGTTTQASANFIVTVTDAGVDNDVSTAVAQAPTNTAFRGIEYILPVPEPASLSVLALGGLLLTRRRSA